MFKKENRVETILALCTSVTIGAGCVLLPDALGVEMSIAPRIVSGIALAVIVFLSEAKW